MSDIELTEAEELYLKDLEKLPTSIRSRLIGWALELVPSIGLFVYGMNSDKRVFTLLGFLSLLYFSIWRMYSQFRGFLMLSRIYVARLAESTDH